MPRIKVQNLPLSESNSRLPLSHIRNRQRLKKSNQMTSWILNRVNGQEEQLTHWSQINWRQVNKLIRNLQRRIFRARKLGEWKKLRRLQKLLSQSYANLLISVRQITQTNKGKYTPGVDKEVVKTPEGRVKLVNNWVMPKAHPTRRVLIPKNNGKKRPLGIPTIKALSRDTCKIVPHPSLTLASHSFQSSLPSNLLHISL